MRTLVSLLAVLVCASAHAICLDYAEQPGWAGEVLLTVKVADFASSGQIAYIADGTASLRVLDVGGSAGPALLPPVTLPGNARAISVSGSTAHVACDTAGLVVLDLSSPATPTVAGTYPTASAADVVTSLGSTAFVGTGDEVILLDTSTPAAPAFLASIPVAADRLGAAGSRLVAHSGKQMISYDVSSVTAPREEGLFELGPGGDGYSEWFGGLAVTADIAFTILNERDDYGDGTSIRVHDLTSTGPAIRSVASFTAGEHADGLALGADALFANAPDAGVVAFDITDPDNLTVAHRLATKGSASALHAAKDGSSTVVLVGRRILNQPPIAQCIEATHLARTNYGAGSESIVRVEGLAEFGDYAYLHRHWYDPNTGHEGSHLSHWDLSDPADPRQMSTVQTGAVNAFDLELAGSDIYFSTGQLYRSVVGTPGISPGPPQAIPVLGTNLEVSGDLLFVAQPAGFSVLDVSGDPAVLASVGLGEVRDIAVDGDLGCALGVGFLQEFDVSDPSNPVLGAQIATGGAGYWVDMQGNLAVIGAGNRWLRIFELGDGIRARGTYLLPDHDSSGEIDLPLLYIGIQDYGLLALDLTDPDAPVLVGSVAMDQPHVVRVGTGRILVGETQDVVVIPPACEVSTSAPLASGPVARILGFPNPFRTVTTWRWSGAEILRADILDVAGRRVSSLGVDPAGGSVSWNGRDHTGASVPAGVYFVRFETESGPVTSKVVRAR